jgi:hypothetical protein
LRLRHIGIISIGFGILLLSLPLISDIQLFHIILSKKAEFNVLKNGSTELEVLHFFDAPIYTTLSIFKNAFLEPIIYNSRNLIDMLLSIEFMFYFIFSIFLFTQIKLKSYIPFIGIFIFCMITLLFIGYTIPNYGTIVRYKSVPNLLFIYSIVLTYLYQEEKTNTAKPL